jgi:hypothetical protein
MYSDTNVWAKNRAKTAGPVGRVLFALAMKVFTKLSKPEKMAWMFDYRIEWDAPVAPGARVSANVELRVERC